jgi:hypothetical protein
MGNNYTFIYEKLRREELEREYEQRRPYAYLELDIPKDEDDGEELEEGPAGWDF